MLPYDIFNYIIDIGNISRQDLINFSEANNHRVEDIFRKALKKEYGLDCKEKCKDLYIELMGIFENYDKNRATVLLVNLKGELKEKIEELYPGFRKYLKRGDIIEDISTSGYRRQGVYMYDGENVIDLNYEKDEYGSPSKEFLVFKEFPPDYWENFYMDENSYKKLNINNIYCPNEKSKFYWDDLNPVLVDKNVLLPIVEKGLSKDVKSNKFYYYNFVIVDYKDKKYRVVIPDDFLERDELYYHSYGDEFIQYINVIL